MNSSNVAMVSASVTQRNVMLTMTAEMAVMKEMFVVRNRYIILTCYLTHISLFSLKNCNFTMPDLCKSMYHSFLGIVEVPAPLYNIMEFSFHIYFKHITWTM